MLISQEYFEWLKNWITTDIYSTDLSYQKLLSYLYDTNFYHSKDIPKDSNREVDGIDLRYRFMDEYGYSKESETDFLRAPCSIFEMMLALSIRINETIMDNPKYGNRTAQWFWGMISSLGLGKQDDANFDEQYCHYILDRFLNHEYKYNGEGGLFTIDNPDCDMRTIEIWWQASRYLNSIE